mmetsp:Transcript_35351/g.92458  ORF Transcript_35351/g.92458 Transcript_35351/m.92458 type:complete len:268 (+) Transcript_35351:133-936(+)|eukprot:CAMPEP_0182917540 /NCGR_PEP_ID=MMETSP0105_2-20130417/1582_1 /TAXON_ID=81532 ORGANISM="Acanthoeca-like sp., Strain 10tr" /NCGR_SAMPLE_ID=MMETSP0105_2 /ASSEMBLY_ACC=CAM_ASM_000205 /LENGTH=267 /DNA_ID=CAMNT_0025054553 /DNA_START=127 /DNA_END=930 /DNA_ORIENTATION=+
MTTTQSQAPSQDATAAPPLPASAVLGIIDNVLALLFYAMLLADHGGYISVLDPEYRKTGFCTATTDTHSFDSMELCFYIDTAATALILGKVALGANVKNAYGVCAALFVHGAFHLSQTWYGWPYPPVVDDVVHILFAMAFVGGFGIGRSVGNLFHFVAVVVAIELFRRAFVTLPFEFAYANAWIYAIVGTVAAVEGARGEPPISVFVALFFFAGAVVPFGEATLCNTGWKDLGGHAIFDGVIAAGVVAQAYFPSETGKLAKGKEHSE